MSVLRILALQAGVPVRPAVASKMAASVDNLFYALSGAAVFFTVLIFGLIFYFMIRYRRRSEEECPEKIEGSTSLEFAWIFIPLLINMGFFLWAAILYFRYLQPPAGAAEIFVVGKQWMWQLQHPEGPREINSLHLPVGVPVKLTMISEDVIHDFFVPAFRSKMDVLPGHYTQQWFQPENTGTYHLFCAQYCGTLHSGMVGWIYVMEPDQYSEWLRNSSAAHSMSEEGKRVFARLGCGNCHVSGTAPSLAGIFGKVQVLASGEKRRVDEQFLRDVVVRPEAVAPGGAAQMPTFQGQLNEMEMMQLIQYIKSLSIETELRPRP